MRVASSRVTSIRIAFAIFGVVLLVNCGRSAANYLKKGNQLFEQDKFAEAELNYRKALQKDPKNGEAYHRLGLTDLKLDKPGDAYQALSLAVQLAPANRAAKIDLANFALSAYLLDPKRPKVLYDLLSNISGSLLSENASSHDGLRVKAYLALVEHRAEEAELLFRRANEAKPGQPDVVVGWMYALDQAHRLAEAEQLGLDSLAKGTSAGAVYDALYQLYASAGRQDEAERILIRKTKDNPKVEAYILQLAVYYASKHKPAEMTAALQPLLANPSAFPYAHREAGDFYLATGDLPKALEQYKAGVTAEPKDVARYQNRIARVWALQNKRDEAVQLLNGVIKANPDYKEARALRAILLAGKGASDDAVREFQSLVDKTPEDVSLRFLYSKALLEKGSLSGARTQLLEVTKRSPGFVQARVDLADVALRQGQLNEALEHARAALEFDPNEPRAQYIRGSALLGLGNLDQASMVFNSLARQWPKSIDVRLQLALLDSRRKKFSEAEAAYKRILEAAPNDWRALAGLVDNFSAQRRLDRAFPLLEEKLKQSRGAAPVRRLLAETATKDGRYDLAVEQYRQLAVENPTTIDPLLGLSEVLKLKGDVADARSSLEEAAARQPKDVRPIALLAALLRETGKGEEAKDHWRQALALRPDDSWLINNLAFEMAETGDNLDEALKLARQACAKEPNDPDLADTLGWVYLKKGMSDDALQVFRKLSAEHRDNSFFSYHFGVTLHQKGEKAAARRELIHALGLNPPQSIKERIKETLRQMN